MFYSIWDFSKWDYVRYIITGKNMHQEIWLNVISMETSWDKIKIHRSIITVLAWNFPCLGDN